MGDGVVTSERAILRQAWLCAGWRGKAFLARIVRYLGGKHIIWKAF